MWPLLLLATILGGRGCIILPAAALAIISTLPHELLVVGIGRLRASCSRVAHAEAAGTPLGRGPCKARPVPLGLLLLRFSWTGMLLLSGIWLLHGVKQPLGASS